MTSLSTIAAASNNDDDAWRDQLRRSITTLEGLEAQLTLSDEEREGVRRAATAGLPLQITPYYLSLFDPTDPSCPIRRQAIPHADEASVAPGDMVDPLGENPREVVSGLVHRYRDRALLIATDHCSVYCRFCTRSRLVGAGEGALPDSKLDEAIAYLREHAEIRDVIVSGGDPLTMASPRIARLLAALRTVPSVEVIRIATRTPVTLPQRITPELLRALSPFHPLWIMTHFNHPRELSPEAQRAITLLVNAGFPVMNQTVLMKGINDTPEVLETLFRGLVRLRAKPYYLLQMDPIAGSRRFRTPLELGPRLIAALEGKLSGIAIPKFVVDTPGGFGKVNVTAPRIVDKAPGITTLVVPSGRHVDYIDPS